MRFDEARRFMPAGTGVEAIERYAVDAHGREPEPARPAPSTLRDAVCTRCSSAGPLFNVPRDVL